MMGRAHKPPAANYTRRLAISEHAIERFRERVDEEFKARGDRDLGNLLDERIRVSTERVEIIDHIGGSRPSALVRIANRNDAVNYAVVRDATVVSVLTAEMAQNNFASGAWSRGPMNPVFKKALQGMKALVLPVPAPPVKISPAPMKIVPPDPHDALRAAGAAYAEATLAHALAVEALAAAQREVERTSVAKVETSQRMEAAITALSARKP